MRKSPSTTIEKLCSLLQNSKPGNSVPTLFTAARAFSTNVAVNRPRQHDKNRDDNSETPQYWPGVANENQCPQCPSRVQPGLPPWGPHVRFRRVQTLVREDSPSVKLRNSA